MGRVFEKRKHKMFARFAKMAKTFTRIGKEISIAVKAGGPHPEGNPRLRMVMQNAKSVNMPKDRVEAAIKRASTKEEKDFEEIVYEGYGPYGVAILIECATDNPTRTVANVRLYFNRANGALGKTGSLDFIFERKGIFRIASEGVNTDELELELIDAGCEEISAEEDGIYITTSFADFGGMQRALEDKKLSIISAELDRIPSSYAEVTEEHRKEILDLIDKLEEDDDIQNVYHNMKEE
jgi:YebC/PmpR family DNA-binding regulatory protein